MIYYIFPVKIQLKRSVLLSKKYFLPLFFAFFYAYILAQLPDNSFKDFNNYLIYAESSWLILLQNLNGGLLAFLANEPLWLIINSGLALSFGSENVVRTIIFFSAASTAFFVLNKYPKYFILLVVILLLSQIIKNYLIHIRQGLAIAVFLGGWLAANKNSRWVLMGLTPFIHTSFIFILLLLFLARLLRAIRFTPILNSTFFIVAGIAISQLLRLAAEMLGARQAGEYAFVQAEVSGAAFFLWLVIACIMLTAHKFWQREHIFEIGIVFFYLATYWLIEVTARIFESGLIVVLLAGLSLSGWRRPVFFGTVLCAGGLSWILSFDLPSLGFAV